ncbi:enoyl-CoA delta isomerase 2, peroxisomal-like isoform X1 [Asterias rubens]|uniref:enoyl-CoA delta isomerase 2, peroxisomal-like isoform X1 n=2 Tax=Asterias rubens TaxID=7604 RepID=UPI00145547A3|nr:enoyl-CoA delta isomerase 2, peroxisomal-like isoform X1 [Asterias rubens]XP_033625972.1 enoyl-CoA delta isomerase 2, peroxisomal-like isoform X1 [Asterias rubens]
MSDASKIPAGVHVHFIKDVAILWLNNGENRFNQSSLREINAALDQVERNGHAKAMIITGVGKFFSCGLDTAWISQQDTATLTEFFPAYENLLQRMLTFPLVTLAAINGHAYAAGGIIAMACDYRIMRTQRGWICFPEINIKVPFRPETASFLRMKLKDNIVFRDLVLYGQRLTAEEAVQRAVVDQCVEMKDLINSALAFTTKRIGTEGFDRQTLQQMKQNLYGNFCRQDIGSTGRSMKEVKVMFTEANKARL